MAKGWPMARERCRYVHVPQVQQVEAAMGKHHLFALSYVKGVRKKQKLLRMAFVVYVQRHLIEHAVILKASHPFSTGFKKNVFFSLRGVGKILRNHLCSKMAGNYCLGKRRMRSIKWLVERLGSSAMRSTLPPQLCTSLAPTISSMA